MMTADAIRQLNDTLRQSPETYPTINKECLLELIQSYEKDVVFLQSLIADLKAESSAYDIGKEEGVQWVLEFLRNSRLGMTYEKMLIDERIVISGHAVASQIAKAWKERE